MDRTSGGSGRVHATRVSSEYCRTPYSPVWGLVSIPVPPALSRPTGGAHFPRGGEVCRSRGSSRRGEAGVVADRPRVPFADNLHSP